MGSLWRSEEMVLLQMMMQKEAAHDSVEQLGHLGAVEFIDVRKIIKKVIKPFK
jgi:hypothetical protein